MAAVIAETWAPVEGWPYEVSDRGRVRRVSGQRGTRKGRMLKLRVCGRGYVTVSLSDRERKKGTVVHRLVLEAFVGACPGDGYTPNHKNGIKTDNRVENLEWVTCSQNSIHAIETGLLVPRKGENAGTAKLSRADFDRIIYMLEQGVDRSEIAARHRIRTETVSEIVTGRCWGTEDRGRRANNNVRRSNKLRVDDVRFMRRVYPAVSARELAEMFGISVGHASSVVSGRRWRDV